MTLLLLHVSRCLMVNVEFVDVIGIVVPNVPSLQVLHRGSPHREKPIGVCACSFACILVKCIVLPLPLEKLSPHSSHTLFSLSMVVVELRVSGG